MNDPRLRTVELSSFLQMNSPRLKRTVGPLSIVQVNSPKIWRAVGLFR